MKRSVTIMGVGLGLATAACVPAPRPMPGPDAVGPITRIDYSTSPCFGACPVYAVSVEATGTGTFEGKRFTAASGTRRFTLTRAQFDAFAAALAPYRPAAGASRRIVPGEPGCKLAATDMPGVEISWSGARGPTSLSVYFGCDMEANRAMFDAIGNAPDRIPALATLIGERP